jgi:hypothetical protein
MKSGGTEMKRDSIMVVHRDDQSRQTADIIRRFNDVFQLHDPSALAELVAADCVIEKHRAGAGWRPPCRP